MRLSRTRLFPEVNRIRLVPFTALEDAGLKPQPSHSDEPRIGDPVRHHPQQPFVVDPAEEAAMSTPIEV
jgi:hypothetical protein